MNTKPNFRNIYFALIALAITLTACGGAPAPTQATEIPATPAPIDLEYFVYDNRAVDAAQKSCENLPAWFIHDDFRATDRDIRRGGIIEIAVGQVEVTYIAYALVYINDRLVEFERSSIEVFQLYENRKTYELSPEKYITRAVEILGGDVKPVILIATWRWVEDEKDWEVTNVTCSR